MNRPDQSRGEEVRETISALKGTPEVARERAAETDAKLRDQIRENPRLANFLDFRLLAIAAAIAFVVGLIVDLLGPGLLAVIAFILVFAGSFVALARTRDPRPELVPSRRRRRE